MTVNNNNRLYTTQNFATNTVGENLAVSEGSTGTENTEASEGSEGGATTQVTNFASHPQLFRSFLAESNALGAGEPQTQVNDLPSNSNPANLSRQSSAHSLALSPNAASVDTNTFGMACVQALNVSRQQPGGTEAVNAWLNSFKSPAVKAAVQKFLAENGNVNQADLVDAYGNYASATLDKAKGYKPTSDQVPTAAAPAASPVSTPSTTAPTTSGNSGASQSDPTTWKVSVNQSALGAYQYWANTDKFPQVQQDAKNVLADIDLLQKNQQWVSWATNGLAEAKKNGKSPTELGNPNTNQDVAYWEKQVKDSTSTMQTTWQKARADEVKFWQDLAAATGTDVDKNALNQYTQNPLFTTEGNMPNGFATTPAATTAPTTGGTTPPATPPTTTTPTTAGVPTTTPPTTAGTPATTEQKGGVDAAVKEGASSALKATNRFDAARLETILTDANVSQTMSREDFQKLTMSYAEQFTSNPSAFYRNLSAIADKRLSGAIAYAVQDTFTYHGNELRGNGATEATESARYGKYFDGDAVKSGKYQAWAPKTQDAAYQGAALTAANDFLKTCHRSSDVKGVIDGTIKMDEHKFSIAARAFTNLYLRDPQQFYAKLNEVKDPKTRAALNYAVMDFLGQRADHGGDKGKVDEDFKAIYRNNYGKVGLYPNANGAVTGNGQLSLNASSSVGGTTRTVLDGE